MPQPIRKGPFWICRKTGKIVGLELKSRWLPLFLPLTGFFALLWYLVRVLPKPARAAYPCQRAAAPLAAGFVGYLLALPVAVMAFRKGRRNLWRARYVLAAMCFLISAVAGLVSLSTNTKDTHAAFISTDGPNSPMGAGKGVFPGRVAWVFDPTAASWGGSGNWWDDAWNNQTAIDGMMSQCVRCVGGQGTDAASWDALFRSFNQRRGKGSVGYAAGEKFAIKINMNNNGSQAANNNINASPHMVLALLKQLINQAGVAQSNITVFDASRFIPDNIYNKCHAQFPGVVFVDNAGGNGRVQSTYVSNAIPFSVASSNQKDLAACVVQASYVINLALLKGHVYQGVTLCGKNFFGATRINADYTRNSAYHNYFSANANGTPSYQTFTDFLGHKDLGGKTILFMIDGLYASQTVGGAPNQKWQMKPFNNRWPSSLFVSEDGVAVDSVALDFLRSEWPNMADMAYCDMYLHEAALAGNPPSHTVYKPDGVNVLTNSLGVHEHWNNATNKQYSRNLAGTGTGIELVAMQPGLGISVGITNPTAGAVFGTGADIPLQVTVTSTSAPVSKVEYYRNGTLIGIGTVSPFNVVWSNATAGSWTLTVVATATNNFSGISPAVNITVQTNQQPGA